MLDSEKLAIAAHLHVLLRRKAGRVTDIEWMVSSTEYAREIIRFTRQKAVEDSHADLADWADQLANDYPQWQAFAQQVRQYADHADLTQLRTLVSRCQSA